MSRSDVAVLEALLQDAADAAEGDSNDAEIEALNHALDQACRMLGFERPEASEPDGAPCCPAPQDHDTTDGSCDFPGYARNH